MMNAGKGMLECGNYGWAQATAHHHRGKPTLKPKSSFDVVADCKCLNDAMGGFGSDKNELVSIMCRRNAEQRVEIVKCFKAMYGEDLVSRFESELSGKLQRVLTSLCYSPAEFDAIQLNEALSGGGTSEDVLIEILCTRSNRQIDNIKEAYSQLYPGQTLEDDIKDDTSGDFQRLLVALLQARRGEIVSDDFDQAYNDANELFMAGENKFGTDESVFIQVLTSRSDEQIQKIIQSYRDISGQDLSSAIKSEVDGHFCQALLTIVAYMENKDQYFAQQLKKSMHGLGTNDNTLIRVIISRAEVDLASIESQFSELTGSSLCTWIEGDTSGAYRDSLCTLAGYE